MKRYNTGVIHFYLLGFLVVVPAGSYVVSLVIELIGVSFIADWSRFLTFLYGALITVVIQLITKTYSLGELEGLRSEQHFKAEKIVKEKARRLWALAGFYLFAAATSLLLPLAVKISDSWGYYGAFVVGMALVLSIYLAARIPVWFEELREFKWKVEGQLKLEQEREALTDEMREHATKGFQPDDKMDGSKRVHH